MGERLCFSFMSQEDKKIDRNHVYFCKGLKHVITESKGKLTQLSISKLAGVSPVNMSRVMNSPFGTTPKWRKIVAEAAGTTSGDLIDLGLRLSGEIPDIQQGEKDHEDGRRIPLLSWEQAADWPEVSGGVSDWVKTNGDHSNNSFAMTIKTDSMAHEFQIGETIIVDTEITPVSGMFVITKMTNTGNKRGVDIGQLIMTQSSTLLSPTNSRYPVFDLSNFDYQIVGVIVLKQKTYPK